MRRTPFAVRAIALVATLTCARAASASAPGAIRVEQATFEGSILAGAEPLRLRGAGVLRWGFFVKVYAAALYAPDGPFRLDADAPRRIELTYFVPFDADALRGAADHVLRQNFPPEALAPLRARLDAFQRSYVAVRSGDRVAITYLPGRGTELTLNGRRLALVPGADFARAYFAIFLGAHPIDAGVRRSLLGG